MYSRLDSEEHARKQAVLRVCIRGSVSRIGELRVKVVFDSIEQCHQIEYVTWTLDPGHRHGECNVQSVRLVTRSVQI